ncbi:MAG TPA: hypothetical protein PK054_06225 [Anaerohalosphaeraceae bacterium]|nr:hypothetical protein [Anaerohalosphaeraceae bacterium]HOL88909.1 hypothetical protein [Anaerohalosphaeraceae bacterium]HPP56165.1 hypothetical protein [Anaerohalosphaeraceae bacterium]
MIKNSLITLLCLACLVLSGAVFSTYHRLCEDTSFYEFGHPYPRKDRLYTARDPDNQQICFLLNTTEWTGGIWSLDLCYKTEENKIVEFHTHGLNRPNNWLPLKSESADPNHLGKLLLSTKIEERTFSPLPVERILSYLEKK